MSAFAPPATFKPSIMHNFVSILNLLKQPPPEKAPRMNFTIIIIMYLTCGENVISLAFGGVRGGLCGP